MSINKYFTMKIQELEITKLARDHAEPWYEVFTHYGWEILGTGREAYVALNPHKNYVIKIWRQPSAYNKYVDFVKKHPNPHFPRFFREPRRIPGTNFYYIALEKLEPLKDNLLNAFLPEMIYLGLTFYNHRIYFQQRREVNQKLAKIFPDRSDIRLDSLVGNQNLQEKTWAKIGHPPDTWKKAVQQIVEFANNWHLDFDLPDFNFMRWHDTLVITDPF